MNFKVPLGGFRGERTSGKWLSISMKTEALKKFQYFRTEINNNHIDA